MKRFINSGIIDKAILKDLFGEGEEDRYICLNCCWVERHHAPEFGMRCDHMSDPTTGWLDELDFSEFAHIYFGFYQVRMLAI